MQELQENKLFKTYISKLQVQVTPLFRKGEGYSKQNKYPSDLLVPKNHDFFFK